MRELVNSLTLQFAPAAVLIVLFVLFVSVIVFAARMIIGHESQKSTSQKNRGAQPSTIANHKSEPYTHTAHHLTVNVKNHPRKFEALPEDLSKWRKIEHLGENGQLYRIPDTDLYSPYPVELTAGERELVKTLTWHFKRSCILVDNYFVRPGHKTVQIDCIAVDERGVFIFESKGCYGWIFGNGNQPKWTQGLAYGQEKHRFYNPIKQNAGHLSTIRSIIGQDIKLHSVVVFGAGAVLKDITYVPTNCRVCSIHSFDKALESIENSQLLTQKQIAETCSKLRAARIRVTQDMRERHVDTINDALGVNRVYV